MNDPADVASTQAGLRRGALRRCKVNLRLVEIYEALLKDKKLGTPITP